MKRAIIAFLLALLIPASALAATNVFLHDAASKIVPPAGWLFNLADGTQGSSKVTAVTNTITGPLTGHYWPIGTAGYFITKTAGGSKLVWLSAPLSAGVTISGTITPRIYGFESNNLANAAFRFQILRWTATGGVVSSVGLQADSGVTEYSTVAVMRVAPTIAAPTSTAFNIGDRIVIVIYNDDAISITEATGYTLTIDYDGGTGVDGDSYITFTEAISFSADSNNAPAWSMVSYLLDGLLFGEPITSQIRDYFRAIISGEIV